MAPIRILLIDNYDSYTHNLYHLLAASNSSVPPVVIRADAYPSLDALRNDLGPFDAFVVSPGPGSPHLCRDFTQLARDVLSDATTPALGVCLGMQALCAIHGAKVVRSSGGPVHGRRSKVILSNHGRHCQLLAGLPDEGFWVVRYHSLAVSPNSLPPELLPCAWTSDADGSQPVLMAVRHCRFPHYGVQFHPESVQTEFGTCIADNFIHVVRQYFRQNCLPSKVGSCRIQPPRLSASVVSSHQLDDFGASRQLLRVLHKRISSMNCDCSDVYKALFGKSTESFWLDSSSSIFLSRSMSKCSSPHGFEWEETDDTSEAGGSSNSLDSSPSHVQRGRFSVMGDLRGPRAELVTYRQRSRTVHVRRNRDSSHYLLQRQEKDSLNSKVPEDGQDFSEQSSPQGRNWSYRNTSIFEFLKRRLSERQISPAITCFEYEQAPGEENSKLPLEFNGGYVGYCGYEAKADVDGTSPNKHESSLPDAWYAFADRVVVFDHLENSAYMIAVVSADVPLSCDGYKLYPNEKGYSAESDGTKPLKTSVLELQSAIEWFDETGTVLRRVGDAESPSNMSFMSIWERRGNSSVISRTHNLQFSNEDRDPACRKRPLQFALERSPSLYKADIDGCLEFIRAGESYEVCLTNRLRTTLPNPEKFSVLDIYCTLRRMNPAPYGAFLRLAETTAICSSSPETFLQISSNGTVISKPIKGTRPRGSSLHQDRILAEELQRSVKDRSENLMIVDLVRNDLGRVATVGSVSVPKLMHVETYANVHQLVSTVQSQLAKTYSPVDCIREAFPMGSMTGAPKVRTMELIDSLEHSARGVYSGTIGYMSLCGAVDLSVVIRTAVVRGSNVEIGVGGAIVALSNPDEEFEEILVKGRPLMATLALVATGSTDFVVCGSDPDAKLVAA